MEQTRPNILVFASGTKTGGGSGFENMVKADADQAANFRRFDLCGDHESL